jgi:hypothetical protein
LRPEGSAGHHGITTGIDDGQDGIARKGIYNVFFPGIESKLYRLPGLTGWSGSWPVRLIAGEQQKQNDPV